MANYSASIAFSTRGSFDLLSQQLKTTLYLTFFPSHLGSLGDKFGIVDTSPVDRLPRGDSVDTYSVPVNPTLEKIV